MSKSGFLFCWLGELGFLAHLEGMVHNFPLSEGGINRRYNYILLQKGTLPLSPDKSFDLAVEHRCSSVLIWPEGEQPAANDTIITDPCFTVTGFKYAERQLTELELSFTDLDYIFITHRHRDHLLNLLHKKKFPYFWSGNANRLPGINVVPCPGHARDLRSLVVRSTSDQIVWIVGDAVLDLEWLKAWEYYWPNSYTPPEIVQTWESVAKILLYADVIIPGHGAPIEVTASLVKDLLSTFPLAEHAENCRDVERFLSDRLERLLAEESKDDAEKPCEDQ